MANAALDSIPMVVIAGDIPSYYYGRHPHQEVNLHQDADQFQIFRPFCKRVYRVDRVRDLPRIIERAFHLAQTGRPGPVLVDVPMDIFSADLPIDAFARTPPEIAQSGARSGDGRAHRRCAGDARAAGALCRRRRAVRRAPPRSSRRSPRRCEMPVAHTLMGKGCLPHEHPLLLGQTGFWGTPIANEKCRTADLIVAVGTRLAEANSSSWDPRFTFAIPPTRLMHIDADLAEIGRNYQTELGVVADAKLALAALADAARGKRHRDRGRAARGDRAAAGGSSPTNWAHQWSRRTSSRCGPSAF